MDSTANIADNTQCVDLSLDDPTTQRSISDSRFDFLFEEPTGADSSQAGARNLPGNDLAHSWSGSSTVENTSFHATVDKKQSLDDANDTNIVQSFMGAMEPSPKERRLEVYGHSNAADGNAKVELQSRKSLQPESENFQDPFAMAPPLQRMGAGIEPYDPSDNHENSDFDVDMPGNDIFTKQNGYPPAIVQRKIPQFFDIANERLVTCSGYDRALDSIQLAVQDGLYRTNAPELGLLEAIITTAQSIQPRSLLSTTLSSRFWLGNPKFKDFAQRRLLSEVTSSLAFADEAPESVTPGTAQALLDFLGSSGFTDFTLGVASYNPDQGFVKLMLHRLVDQVQTQNVLWVYELQIRGKKELYGLERRQPPRMEHPPSPVPVQPLQKQPQPQTKAKATLKRKRDTDSLDEQLKPSSKRLYRAHGVEGAPSQNTDLPFEHMDEVTAEELIVFFPNHVLKWPAVCARVCEDGFTAKQIADLINQYRRGTSSEGSAIDAVAPSTVQADVEAMNREFHGDFRWAAKTRPRVPAETYATTPWGPSGSQTNESLARSWKLVDIGLYFGNNPYDIPATGRFSEKVARAVEFQGAIGSEILTPSPQGSNPPALPEGWTSAVQNDSSFKIYESTPISKASYNASRAFQNQAHAGSGGASLTRESLEPAIRDDPEAIMRSPDKCAGQILLWLLSRRGGKQNLTDVETKCNASIRAANELLPDSVDEVKELTRNAYNHRKKSALKYRAKVKETTYEEEKTEFNTNEAFRRPANK